VVVLTKTLTQSYKHQSVSKEPIQRRKRDSESVSTAATVVTTELGILIPTQSVARSPSETANAMSPPLPFRKALVIPFDMLLWKAIQGIQSREHDEVMTTIEQSNKPDSSTIFGHCND
jgi:hypothetical protein